jgi:hypothetical protein
MKYEVLMAVNHGVMMEATCSTKKLVNLLQDYMASQPRRAQLALFAYKGFTISIV